MTHLRTIGYYSALLSLIFAIGYAIPQILSSSGILPHPKDLFWLFLPSLFLGPAFLATMVCLHYMSGKYKIWTALGWSFAIMYCSMVTIVYFVELTVVIPPQLRGDTHKIELLLFDRKSFLMAIDCLGYFFMSLSTLFAAFAFRHHRNKWLYRGMLWNGLLMPILILAYFYPEFYYVGAIWIFTFPLAMINAAKYFRHAESGE